MKMIISLSVILHYVQYCHPNLKMSSRYKVMCGCECCISAKSMHSSLLSWCSCCLKKLRISVEMLKKEGLGKKKICIYDTYKNIFMPHGRHISTKSYDMVKAAICAYSQSDHALPRWKCVLRCCAKCPISRGTVTMDST